MSHLPPLGKIVKLNFLQGQKQSQYNPNSIGKCQSLKFDRPTIQNYIARMDSAMKEKIDEIVERMKELAQPSLFCSNRPCPVLSQ